MRRDALAELDRRVAEQWRDVLERCRTDAEHGVAAYVDAPGAPWKVRPTCDAVEIAAAFGDVAAAGPTDELVAWLQGLQDPATGLFPDPTEPPLDEDPIRLRLDAEYQTYGVLSVGYALEVLGAAPREPVHVVEQLEADELVARLDALPWPTLAWPAGAWVDFYGTAVYLNRRYHGSIVGLEPLIGWLTTRVDRHSGMWGQVDPGDWGWLMPVNGFYRLTRGTYAQFDLPLPHPEAAIDTVALHCRENGWFVERNRSACNVLDVVHPIWLAAKQTDHRRAELRDALAAMLADTCGRWVDGEGFAFSPTSRAASRAPRCGCRSCTSSPTTSARATACRGAPRASTASNPSARPPLSPMADEVELQAGPHRPRAPRRRHGAPPAPSGGRQRCTTCCGTSRTSGSSRAPPARLRRRRAARCSRTSTASPGRDTWPLVVPDEGLTAFAAPAAPLPRRGRWLSTAGRHRVGVRRPPHGGDRHRLPRRLRSVEPRVAGRTAQSGSSTGTSPTRVPPLDDVAYALVVQRAVPDRRARDAVAGLHASPPPRRHRIEVFADAYGIGTDGLVDAVVARQRKTSDHSRILKERGLVAPWTTTESVAQNDELARWSDEHRHLFE